MVHRRAILSTAAVVMVLGACTPSPARTLLDSNCGAPCWQGILPGTTTADGALELIPRIDAVSEHSLTVRDHGAGRKRIEWVMDLQRGYTLAELSTRNDVVSALCLSVDKAVDVKEVIQVYGQPDTLAGFYGQGEVYGRSLILLYDQGIALILGDYGWPFIETWRVSPRDGVDSMCFFDPDLFTHLVGEELITPVGSDADALVAALVPWQGYSTIALHPVP